ncbi:hypothetical protein GPECTOR_96g732 [Gonium pectorale]|uniref:Uncharacterized protein n=1 Tax=Gonium pectorale TaxID=33097 RepID=A0A150G063_GONPE|nr:hypothetical protein GPECTOR_96g732 [Gonium pectorale]|eukprot:KXZ43266.1 hypothetical protein GPECTOR_96g732 [Gonium pectorale]
MPASPLPPLLEDDDLAPGDINPPPQPFAAAPEAAQAQHGGAALLPWVAAAGGPLAQGAAVGALPLLPLWGDLPNPLDPHGHLAPLPALQLPALQLPALQLPENEQEPLVPPPVMPLAPPAWALEGEPELEQPQPAADDHAGQPPAPAAAVPEAAPAAAVAEGAQQPQLPNLPPQQPAAPAVPPAKPVPRDPKTDLEPGVFVLPPVPAPASASPGVALEPAGVDVAAASSAAGSQRKMSEPSMVSCSTAPLACTCAGP